LLFFDFFGFCSFCFFSLQPELTTKKSVSRCFGIKSSSSSSSSSSSYHHRGDEFPIVRGRDARRRRISAAKGNLFFSLVGGNKRDNFTSRFCATKSTTNKDE
jgi:hypothetical protein